jgi:hypothetical protein
VIVKGTTMKRLIFLCLLLAAPGWAWGATIYIDSDANNAAQAGADGSLARPYTSPDSLPVAASQTVLVNADSPLRGGYAANGGVLGTPTTIGGYKWTGATLNGSLDLTGATLNHGLNAFTRGAKTYAAVGCQAGGLYVVEITTPATPVLRLKYDDDTGGRLTEWHGDSWYVGGAEAGTYDVLYTAGRTGGLYMLDLKGNGGTDLSDCVFCDEDETDAPNRVINRIAPPADGSTPKVTGLWIDEANDKGYIANRTGGWFLVDNIVSAASTCTADAAYKNTYATEVHRMAGAGNYVYAPGTFGWTIEDVSGAAPVTTSRAYPRTITWDVAVRGNYLYMTAFREAESTNKDVYQPGLYIFDISNKYSPFLVGRWLMSNPTDYSSYTPYDSPAYDFVLSGNYALVACGNQGVKIIDVSDPYNPGLAYTIERPSLPTGANTDKWGAEGVDVINDQIVVSWTDNTTITRLNTYTIQTDQNIPFYVSGTAFVDQQSFYQNAMSDNLIDTYFDKDVSDVLLQNGYEGFTSCNRNTVTVLTGASVADGWLTMSGVAGAIQQRAIVRSIQQQTRYDVRFTMRVNSAPMNDNGYFYVNILNYMPTTKNTLTSSTDNEEKLYLICQSKAGNTYTALVRYVRGDTSAVYTNTTAKTGMAYGTTYTIGITYDIAGTNVVYTVDDAEIDNDAGVDFSALSEFPNLLHLGFRTTPDNNFTIDFGQFHYRAGAIDAAGDANVWVASLGRDTGVSPNVLFINGAKATLEANCANVDAAGDWCFDDSGNPDVIKVYATSRPDAYSVEYGNEAAAIGTAGDYVTIDRAIVTGASGAGVSFAGAGSRLKYSILRDNYIGLSGTGAGNFAYNSVIYGNNYGADIDAATTFTNMAVDDNVDLANAITLTATYSLFQESEATIETAGGTVGGKTGVTFSVADFGFRDAANGDFRLQASAFGRNAGDNAVWAGTANVVDLAGRKITDAAGVVVAPGAGNTVDIGAYEWHNASGQNLLFDVP